MAKATSREDCIERHKGYPIDMATPRHMTPLQCKRLATMLALVQPGESVLDVGCNSGYIVDFLPRGCRAYGVDVVPALVEIATTRLVEAKVATAEALPYPDSSIDVVALGEILEHVHDPAEVLREAARVARRLVVGSTPHEEGKWGPHGAKAPDGHRFHVRCFTEPTLRDVLATAGITTLDVSTIDRKGVPQMYVFWGAVLCA